MKTSKEIMREELNKVKIQTFESFLIESPIRMKGNAQFPEDADGYISSISKAVLEMDYKILKHNLIHGLDLYIHNNGKLYVLGDWIYDNFSDKDRFAVKNEVSISNSPMGYSKQKQFKDKKFVKINTAHTLTEWRGRGLSTELYLYILSMGYGIISDSMQYQGAVALWKNFPSVPQSTVWVYNASEDIIISRYTHNTPDTQVWSDDNSKGNIRLVFTKD